MIVADFRLTPSKAKLADIIWDNTPIMSPALVKLCEEKLNWKKSTTYTELRELCEKGIFQNEKALVSILISKDEFYAGHSRRYVAETFDGSLPRFLTAFISGNTLSEQQAKEIESIIKGHIMDSKHG
jgi:predicted transcriptional regulator